MYEAHILIKIALVGLRRNLFWVGVKVVEALHVSEHCRLEPLEGDLIDNSFDHGRLVAVRRKYRPSPHRVPASEEVART